MYTPPQSVHAWTALFGGIHIQRGRFLLILVSRVLQEPPFRE